MSTKQQLRATIADVPLAARANQHDPQLAVIDAAIRHFAGRRLVSSNEVVDVLLEARSAISADPAAFDVVHRY